MTGDQCARCPEPAERTLGAEALCNPCAEQILDPIRMRVAARAAHIDPPPIPPVDLDSERIVLAAIAANPDHARTAIEAGLTRHDFISYEHQDRYDQIRAAINDGTATGTTGTVDPDWEQHLHQLIAATRQRRVVLDHAETATRCADDRRGDITDGSTFHGHGRQDGPLRPDYGPDWAYLRCDRCSATWVGILDEQCAYCEHSLELLIEAQRAVLLDPDLPDPDDERRHAAELAWSRRLALAVKAGIIPENVARRALDNELAKSA